MTEPRLLDTSCWARRRAQRRRNPEFAAAYGAARAEIDAFDARVRAAITEGRLPADWENWSAAEKARAQRIGRGQTRG